jgi:acetone carboxylase gamma subunit
MHHAEFRIVQVEDDRIFIVDENQGKSITNDAEWVFKQITQNYPHRRLIYRDTMNRWDEIVPVHPTDKFEEFTINFRPYHEHIPS